MEQQKVIAHQLELSDINGEGAVYHSPNRKDVTGTDGAKVLQVETAGEHGRALLCNLMELVCGRHNMLAAYKQVKRNKGVGGSIFKAESCSRESLVNEQRVLHKTARFHHCYPT